jgi:hypothetical protein
MPLAGYSRTATYVHVVFLLAALTLTYACVPGVHVRPAERTLRIAASTVASSRLLCAPRQYTLPQDWQRANAS